MTTGLKEAILEFFPGNPLAQARQGSDAGQAGLLCRAAGASQPLAKKSVLQSSLQEDWNFSMPGRLLCRAAGASQPLAKKACCSPPPREDWNFFPGKNPDLGRAPMPGRRGREAGMWRARRWASPYSLGEPSNEVGRAIKRGWASHQTRLGRAIKRGWASQYEGAVGRARTHWASHQTRLGEPVGEPVLIGRASWASQLGEPVLRGRWASQLSQWPPQPLGTVPARHCKCPLGTVSARSALCLLGTVPARHYLQVPARHI